MIAVHENIYCTGEVALRKPGWVRVIAEVKIGLFVHGAQHVQDTPALQPVCGSVASICTAAALAVGSTCMQPDLCLSAHSCSPASERLWKVSWFPGSCQDNRKNGQLNPSLVVSLLVWWPMHRGINRIKRWKQRSRCFDRYRSEKSHCHHCNKERDLKLA